LRDFGYYLKAAKKVGFPVVIKSTRMGKGASVYKIDDERALNSFIDERVEKAKNAKSFIIQEYIAYKYDLRALIIGEHVNVMRRIPGAGEFRANFSLGGSVELFELDPDGVRLARQALAAVGMSVGGVDILITPDNKRYILEVNHTAGFVGMEKATGENIGALFVKHAIKNAK